MLWVTEITTSELLVAEISALRTPVWVLHSGLVSNVGIWSEVVTPWMKLEVDKQKNQWEKLILSKNF